MENYEEFDDCYCPAGVVGRQERNVNIFGGLILIVAALALKLLLDLVSSVVNSVIVAGAAFGTFLGSNAAVILVSVLAMIGVIWMGFDLFHWKAFGRVPRWIRPWKWIIQRLRYFFYMKDLRRRFRERPEISDVTLPEVLLEMYDHHEVEELPTPSQRAAYAKVYESARSKEIDYGREQKRIVADFAQRVLDN